MASEEADAWGSPGEIIPTLLVLLTFTALWGLVQYRDGSVFIGVALAAPLAAGLLSGATARMIFGRGRGGIGAVGGVGTFVFLLMLGASMGVSLLTFDGGPSGTLVLEPNVVALATSAVAGVVGAFLGALALSHYRAQPQEEEEEEEEAAEPEPDADYSTEPEELVCLLTNQVVNREHDRYVVCHNPFNVSQVCHAVYLFDYVHLLGGKCNRCYQPLLKKDLEGRGGPG